MSLGWPQNSKMALGTKTVRAGRNGRGGQRRGRQGLKQATSCGSQESALRIMVQSETLLRQNETGSLAAL